MRLRVDAAAGLLHLPARSVACTIGRAGVCAAADKREGDGRTPIGSWPLRGVLARPDRVTMPATGLPWRWLRPDDGWSDDPTDPAYNRAVRHPHRFSAERLWRDDALYDIIVTLGHNDDPAVPGLGSAIFLHLSLGRPTEGCIAVSREAMLALLPALGPGARLQVD